MFVQYFVIILICWFSSVCSDDGEEGEEGRCLPSGKYILSRCIKRNNEFTIKFCKNRVFYEAVVKNSVERCTCNNGGSQPKCLGQNKIWYDVGQVMSTSGDRLDDCSLVQYCLGIENPCCNRCNTGGCTVNRLTYVMSERYSSLFDFFGNHSLEFY